MILFEEHLMDHVFYLTEITFRQTNAFVQVGNKYHDKLLWGHL
jgi:hypothetical protein